MDFGHNGFAILKGFLAPAELCPLRRAVDDVIALGHDSCCCRPNNTLLPLRWRDRCVDLVLRSERRQEMLVAATQADDLRWISGYVSIKEPYSPPLWWHQDWWCWDHEASYRGATSQIAVMCYLQPTNSANGGPRVLPKTHHGSCDLHRHLPEPHSDISCSLPVDHAAMVDHPNQVGFDLEAGDALAIDYRLLHGAHANQTANRRDCLLLSFAPSWHKLPSDIRGHLVDHLAQPRDDEEQPADWLRPWLPSYDGPRETLSVNRVAPAFFTVNRQENRAEEVDRREAAAVEFWRDAGSVQATIVRPRQCQEKGGEPACMDDSFVARDGLKQAS